MELEAALIAAEEKAAYEIERLRADRLKLDRRIHNQRRALRENWEIVEQRGNWLGSSVARGGYIRLMKQNRELRAALRQREEEIERLRSEIGQGDVEIEHRADQYSTLLHENDRLRTALRDVLEDIKDYERINNLAPNPPRFIAGTVLRGHIPCWVVMSRKRPRSSG